MGVRDIESSVRTGGGRCRGAAVAGSGNEGFSGDGGPATSAELRRPEGVSAGPDGTLYIADTHNHRIRRVGVDGTITTVAGTGVEGFSGDGGPAAKAELRFPSAVAVAPDGTLYITDGGNYRVRRIGPDRTITTVAGTGEAGCSADRRPSDTNQARPQGDRCRPRWDPLHRRRLRPRPDRHSLDRHGCRIASRGRGASPGE